MLSVLTQSAFRTPANRLVYRIRDGGSSDDTVAIVQHVQAIFADRENIEIELVSQKDEGMYDALAAGLEGDRGADVYSYINAGDFYSVHAFSVVAEIFSNHPVQFLTGFSVIYNQRSHLVACRLPFAYHRGLMLKGFYGTVLPHLQQESTFWGTELHRNIDFAALRACRLAGDYALWKGFIRQAPLYIVASWLGGFKIHEGQLSQVFAVDYESEIRALSDTRAWYDHGLAWAYKLMTYLPTALNKRFSSNTFEYDHALECYRLSRR
ncbi:MAG: glycosyltransferase involved in cell wall biosynthesis [Halioglobus sp.]|jgi:glycosyltransferase involved in cell wall biosynthesis